MLSLRLALGAHPLVLLRRLLVTAASAAAGFLLLCTLGYALAHPTRSDGSAARLLWCVVPLAATVQFAVAVARADPSVRAGLGLDSVGLGPTRRARLAAASTALFCTLGSALALAVFLYVRGNLGGPAAAGGLGDQLGRGARLPLGAVFIMLALVPVLAAIASAACLWPREDLWSYWPWPRGERTARGGRRGAARPEAGRPTTIGQAVAARIAMRQAPVPEGRTESAQPPPERARGAQPPPGYDIAGYVGLPWGAALIGGGLALVSYTSRGAGAAAAEVLPLPGHSVASPPGVVVGWVLTALGLMLAGPGLAFLCGGLLAAGRPGPLRLLAGRALQEEAPRLGRPLGVLCAVASGAYGVVELYGAELGDCGPVAGLGAALVMACVTATALTTALEVRAGRAATRDALVRIGAPTRLLRAAAAVRSAALLAVLAGLTWTVAELVTIPLTQ
ncbi:hypothetical protein [Streptomyces sp. XD-27]|uniref:hypothetical protein n=1 Tax=Streptomyces sp. XD-27 TaxID=3062779 RepID=UPI0026F46616|nr:hypothetical protein [Streptomyces sp. XD-27]WKX72866.1 hypothetical protein Q3Y56_25865 [Streptomyces sp. XD-27]